MRLRRNLVSYHIHPLKSHGGNGVSVYFERHANRKHANNSQYRWSIPGTVSLLIFVDYLKRSNVRYVNPFIFGEISKVCNE